MLPDEVLDRRALDLDNAAEGEMEAAAARRRRIESIWEDHLDSGVFVYVEYAPDFRSRGAADFREGWIEVGAALEGESISRPTEEALTMMEGRLAKILSWREPGLGDSPLLDGQIRGVSSLPGEPEALRAEARRLLEEYGVEVTPPSASRRTWLYKSRIPMVPDHMAVREERCRSIVSRTARRFGVDERLVLSIIEVESAFNPRAVSSAGALGLMQVVPSTAGADALSVCPELGPSLDREDYFDAGTNIKLGCAYLHILKDRFFGSVSEDASRTYMTIAAYNGGPGSVARALSGGRSMEAAVAAANSMGPEEVFRTLLDRLPSEETRTYLRNVVRAMQRRGWKAG